MNRPLLYVAAPWRTRTPQDEQTTLDAIDLALALGWAPIFGPFLLPRIKDEIPVDRAVALDFDLSILRRCQGLLVVGERVTEGMRLELAHWERFGGVKTWTPATLPPVEREELTASTSPGASP